MSIVVCVKVNDGIVLGADSATQISGKDDKGKVVLLKLYQNAQKLFQFQKFPIGILTYGIGNLGKKSIQTFLNDFNREKIYPKNNELCTVKGTAEALLSFFKSFYNEQFGPVPADQKPVLGFYIAGYSQDSTLGEEWEFVLPRDEKCRLVRPLDTFGSSWRGTAIPFTRLYFGCDPRARENLRKLGVTDDVINKAFKPLKSNVAYHGMPVQDAIKFVEFILKTTIGLVSFEIGVPSCSEPIRIAVVDVEDLKFVTEEKLTL